MQILNIWNIFKINIIDGIKLFIQPDQSPKSAAKNRIHFNTKTMK